MGQVKTLRKDKVPVGQKAAFGAGHFILNILPGTLGVFIQFFLLMVIDDLIGKWSDKDISLITSNSSPIIFFEEIK